MVDDLLDAVIETGRIDFVADVGAPAPTKFTFDLMGLPMVAAARSAADMAAGYGGGGDMMATLETLPAAVAERREQPRDDMITLLTQSTILGQPASDDIIIGILTSLVFGGSHTSTALLTNSLGWLDQHPEHKQLLVDDPGLVPKAVEEFLRYFPPNLLLGRTVLAGVEVGGQTLSRGERLLMAWASANRDPAWFDDPDDVDFERPNNRHTSFGIGAHRCLGIHHARMEAQIMQAGVLERMPDYRIDWTGVQRYGDVSASDGFLTMPATFTPGTRKA
jgi:cytochrome P450